MTTYNVGVLGCTGSVGQRFLDLLNNHPWFKLGALGASPRSAGKTYAVACSWKLTSQLPAFAADVIVQTCVPENFKGCDFVFSALDSDVAGDVELAFAQAGIAVFSNARNFRMHPTVPLVVPQVNAHHLEMVTKQHSIDGWKGFIVTNANCSTTGLVTVLKPLHEAFKVEKCIVATMQALSGAGYPGIPSMDIIDNVLPYISGEEDKMETEPNKILGDADGTHAKIAISAHCNRVNVTDGHTMNVSLKLGKQASLDEIKKVLAGFTADVQKHNLPSKPDALIVVKEEPNRPQPRLDRDIGAGYTVSVGRVRECPILDVKLTLLVHNTVLGAAGSSILNAEMAAHKGLLKKAT